MNSGCVPDGGKRSRNLNYNGIVRTKTNTIEAKLQGIIMGKLQRSPLTKRSSLARILF